MISDDDLLRIAEEAGFVVTKDSVSIDYEDYTPEIKKFAELVAAKEREACAQLLETTDICGDAVMDELAAAIRARGDQ